MADQFFMTQKGYDEAVERLKYLQTVKRQEIIERIAEARSHGDLSENAEYDAARNEQSANEGEIVELDYKIKNAKIIEENDDTSFVHIGSRVTVFDSDLEEEATYEITGTTESNAMENKISNESPVGAALLKHRVGDVVTVSAPDGAYSLKIVQHRLKNWGLHAIFMGKMAGGLAERWERQSRVRGVRRADRRRGEAQNLGFA